MTRLFSLFAVMETADAVATGDLGITNGTYALEGQDGAVIEVGKWTFVGTKVDGFSWPGRTSDVEPAAARP